MTPFYIIGLVQIEIVNKLILKEFKKKNSRRKSGNRESEVLWCMVTPVVLVRIGKIF